VKGIKLVPRPLDKGPRPLGKWPIEAKTLHGTCSGEKINWFRPKENSAKRRAPDLENQESGQVRDQGTLVQLKDSICFKSIQIGS